MFCLFVRYFLVNPEPSLQRSFLVLLLFDELQVRRQLVQNDVQCLAFAETLEHRGLDVV